MRGKMKKIALIVLVGLCAVALNALPDIRFDAETGIAIPGITMFAFPTTMPTPSFLWLTTWNWTTHYKSVLTYTGE